MHASASQKVVDVGRIQSMLFAYVLTSSMVQACAKGADMGWVYLCHQHGWGSRADVGVCLSRPCDHADLPFDFALCSLERIVLASFTENLAPTW
eukprot:1192386-Amphidinium_carterae.1